MSLCLTCCDEDAVYTIKMAVSKVNFLFRREVFDFEDITQEVLLRMLPFLPIKNQALLYVIAKNKALDYYKSLNTSRNHGQNTHKYLKEESIGPDHWAGIEVSEALDDVEYSLVGRQLEVFKLRRSGLSIKEISKVIGTSQPYVSQVLKKVKNDSNKKR